MSQAIKIAILDAVPRVYWSDDEGITDAEKFVDLLAPENPQAHSILTLYPKIASRLHCTTTMLSW